MVGGGDGTLSEAVHQFAHRDLCLGVLPLGTTNNFARNLGLPLHLPGAMRILTEGKVADVDLGHVAGRHFANLTSLGLSVQVAEHVPHLLKRVLPRRHRRHFCLGVKNTLGPELMHERDLPGFLHTFFTSFEAVGQPLAVPCHLI